MDDTGGSNYGTFIDKFIPLYLIYKGLMYGIRWCYMHVMHVSVSKTCYMADKRQRQLVRLPAPFHYYYYYYG